MLVISMTNRTPHLVLRHNDGRATTLARRDLPTVPGLWVPVRFLGEIVGRMKPSEHRPHRRLVIDLQPDWHLRRPDARPARRPTEAA